MSVVLFKTFEVVLALSVLVFIHESGHFLFAKLFGIRVDKFFIFFDVGGRKLWSKKIGETEYGIGWLPLGGYCKIAGMVDESMDTEALKKDPQPWEFRTRPAWQRFFVMFGGVLFNFIFAILVYSGICLGWGTAYISNDSAKIYTSSLADEMGFRTGDHIIAYDDFKIEDFGTLQSELAFRDVEKAIILRGEDTVNLYIDQAYIPRVLKTPGMFELAYRFVVDSVANASLEGQLLKGDVIIGVNGKELPYFQDIRAEIAKHPLEEVELSVLRDTTALTVCGSVDSLGRVGIYIHLPEELVRTRSYSFLQSFPAGFSMAFETLGSYARSLSLMVRPDTEAYKSVGSFISIGRIFPSAWDWYGFLNILAFLSIILAVMNILPIPGLDGGHILFLLIEIVIRRKLSVRTMMILRSIGMFILVALMVLACGNDIASLF